MNTENPSDTRKLPRTPMEVIEAAFGALSGKRLVDIGCGGGALTGALTKRGANVSGVDPNAEAVAAARAAAPEAEFHVAPGESLPFADASVDGAILVNSLHHIPQAVMGQALLEAARICRNDGTVVIVEPCTHGSFFEALRPVEDETQVRLQAQEAIKHALETGPFRLQSDLVLIREETFADVEAFLARVVAADPARADIATRKRDIVEGLMREHGDAVEGGTLLRQPLQTHVLRVV